MLSNKPLSFDGFNLNYYLVVSWSYYKYLKGSIYHWDTVYQHKWISCASKGQWFRCINMEMGNLQCLDLWIKAVITKWWCGNISGKPPPPPPHLVRYTCPYVVQIRSQLYSWQQLRVYRYTLRCCSWRFVKRHIILQSSPCMLPCLFFFLSFSASSLPHQLWGGLNRRCGLELFNGNTKCLSPRAMCRWQ